MVGTAPVTVTHANAGCRVSYFKVPGWDQKRGPNDPLTTGTFHGITKKGKGRNAILTDDATGKRHYLHPEHIVGILKKAA